MTLAISDLAREGVFQASKWLKLQVLCDGLELTDLLHTLAGVHLYPLTGIVDGQSLSKERFIAEYASWIEGLKQGRVPEETALKRILACAWTFDPSALWLQEIKGKGYLVKIRKPLVQVQAHYFAYSPIDGVFRPMSMGPSSIFWGLQFSFPQIYQNGASMAFSETGRDPLFEAIRLWARHATRPTPFWVQEKKVNSPIRLGNHCFSWINRHPQLAGCQIEVKHAD